MTPSPAENPVHALSPSADGQLRAENAELRARLEEAEETLRAIRTGEVDSLVVETLRGPQVFTLASADATSNRLRGEILAQVSDSVIAIDLEQCVIYLNAAAERQYRISASDVLGRQLSQIYSRQWPSAEAEAAMWGVLHEHGEWRGETIHRMHDGRELQVESCLTLLRDTDGADAGMVFATRDITERKRSEAEFARVGGLLDTLLHTAPIGFCFIDRDLRYVRINERLAEMNGSPAAAHSGRHVSEIVPALVETLRAVTGRILATGQAVLNHEFSDVTQSAPDKTRTWNESWYPVRNSAGEVLGFGAIVEEITARKQAEKTIARQMRELDTLYATAPAGLFQFDADLRYVRVNAWAAAINGRSVEAHIGRTAGEVLDPKVVHTVERLLRQVIQTGEPSLGIEMHGACAANGEERDWLLSYYPVPSSDGEVVGVHGVVLDITERVQAEAALRTSEIRFRRLFEAAKDGVLILDGQTGQITDVNPYILEMLGHTRAEVLGRMLWEIGVFADATASLEAVAELQKRGYVRYENLPLEHKTGQRREVEVVANAYQEGGHRVIQCNIRDITERKKLQGELERSAVELQKFTAELSEADRRKDEFLAMLAHELRNPLAPIRNMLQVLRIKSGDQSAVSSAAEIIERQIGQMVRLVDDLLDVSRVSRGKIELRKERVSLASIIRQAEEATSPICENMKHELTVTLPSRPVEVNGDPVRLIQIVTNLLANACKFTDAGGRIRLSVERVADQAVIRVQDNGIGISADDLPCLFQIFMQADSSRDRSSTGLGIGLALVKNLVEMHGGTVEANSEGMGRGSEFVVRLPTLPTEPQARPAEPAPANPAENATDPTRSLRILVVDDNKDAANSMAVLLKFKGHTTHTAYDGLEAVEAAATFCPDVVLLDIGLPTLNGYEACRRIREQTVGQTIRLVALTGWGQDKDRERTRDAGFDAHLVKPVDFAELLNLLTK